VELALRSHENRVEIGGNGARAGVQASRAWLKYRFAGQKARTREAALGLDSGRNG